MRGTPPAPLDRGERIQKLLIALIFLSLVAALFPLGRSIDRTSPGNTNPVPELFYFPKTDVIKNMAFGYKNLLADVFWLRSIQYIGRHLRMGGTYTYLYHIFDIVTSLDPRFINAYNFGSIMLLQLTGKSSEAIELGDKGVKNNPGNWMPSFGLGFVYYLDKDYVHAYRYFSRANALPGMPGNYKTFAPYAMEKFASPDQSIALWKAIAKMSGNNILRLAAKNNIRLLIEKKERVNEGRRRK